MMKLYQNNVRLAKKISVGTFISGIIFLLGFYLTYDYTLVLGGLFLGLGIFLIVITILTSDLITAKRQHFNPQEKITTILWNVSSLVILTVFTLIGLQLANSSKIIIKNNSSETIKNIYISGCQEIEVTDIDANSSKVVHLFYQNNIDANCAVKLRFTTNNLVEEELLMFEMIPFKGEKIVYEIN